jgi:hypothetical protein
VVIEDTARGPLFQEPDQFLAAIDEAIVAPAPSGGS